jgi:hypothetical protein
MSTIVLVLEVLGEAPDTHPNRLRIGAAVEISRHAESYRVALSHNGIEGLADCGKSVQLDVLVPVR